MFISVFDLYKIGIGPSSSHTMGPMVAATRFLNELLCGDWPRPRAVKVSSLRVTLHGSLAFTAVGHATDRAVILGLCGYHPATIDPDRMDDAVSMVRAGKCVNPDGHPSYAFDPKTDLVFDRTTTLPGHPNGMSFEALDSAGKLLLKRIYYSIGGGFVVTPEERESKSAPAAVHCQIPYPFDTAARMLDMARKSQLSIAQMKLANEEVYRSKAEVSDGLTQIWGVMSACIDRGLDNEGVLPGGLGLKRRAKALVDRLKQDARRNTPNPMLANDWLAAYAMAVNEENAAGARVVTAPTNGAAGVVPAVLRYMLHFHTGRDPKAVETFLLTSAAVGGIIKHNASISGAEVGCQGEVGSAAAMAAAGLTAALGGTAEQVEQAAEIALEHHLGTTCDPVGGLVQVPCIERNAVGAVKAVTAASLALKSDGSHLIALDACIETMRQTGDDMDVRYKETSLGGLAINVPAC
ncbi:L-serine ammonia-lyase [Agrobacterium larrymoorei]|uniref:L-serine dehydratase n=1 Tax=Agrobacterium larrymoorei TaxID=160699 RepID=A0A4D7E4L0_9HYPH|nr:L-serine ammonia-lyase [Agrobacterium larrymoorei]QCJ01103.1 L-serine ammonia-lyase [Agrobacterium larrymoorei]QYA10417.1 L-serine ammonia-lyase [Agrobacterium larrymoorei]